MVSGRERLLLLVPPGTRPAALPLLLLLLLRRDAVAQKGDGCGYTVLGPESGTFTSINYPHAYPNSTVCEWEIRVKPDQRVQLKFGDFDIDDSDSCHFNYVRIYNGIGPTRTEIGKYCGLGLQVDKLNESKGNEITVQFMSDIHFYGHGFLASYSTTDKPDLITCLDTASHFSEPEFSKYCPAGCVLPFAEIYGTIPHGYRDSSSLCMAGVHAGVVSNILGGQINVVISKGIPYYESSLANNVTSKVGPLSSGLFTFKTSGKPFCLLVFNDIQTLFRPIFLLHFVPPPSGCYGTLGMESGVIADSQINASSFLEWPEQLGQPSTWKPERARLKRPGHSWAAFTNDEYQWLQIDLNKEQRITGIITTGSTLAEYHYYVSAYRILYSNEGQKWTVYREPGVERDKVFQGNTGYYQEVRNNFIPPIIARFVRINPLKWHQKLAMKVELLGCQFNIVRAPRPSLPPPPRSNNDFSLQIDKTTFTPEVKNTMLTPSVTKVRSPRATLPPPPRSNKDFPLQTSKTTFAPKIKNTTVTPSVTKDVALIAVLVPVLVMVFTTLILISVCSWHWRNRKRKSEGTYDIPYWDRAGWWKGMKQFFPTKSVDHEESSVHYNSSEINCLRSREATTVLQSQSAEYAQPLVGGIVGTLNQKSAFKLEEGKEASYADKDSCNTSEQEIYHAYAEPLPVTGPEYAIPIVMGMSGHPAPSPGIASVSTFKASGNQAPPLVGTYNKLLSRADSSLSATHMLYDTPKGMPGLSLPNELVYQIPQNMPHSTDNKEDIS